MYVLASAIKEMMSNETITEAPKDCGDSGVNWESGNFYNTHFKFIDQKLSAFSGKRLFQFLKTRNIKGETGQVAFDDNGDRIYAEYNVVNVREKQKKQVVGKFYYDAVS